MEHRWHQARPSKILLLKKEEDRFLYQELTSTNMECSRNQACGHGSCSNAATIRLEGSGAQGFLLE